jgi:chromosome segregation ATPase
LLNPRNYAHYYSMKSNLVAIVLILLCLGLGATLWVQNQKHVDVKKNLVQTIVDYSNHVALVEGNYNEQRQVNAALESNLTNTQIKASNDLAALQATLAATTSNLEKTQADAKAAADAAAATAKADADALAARDKKIADLENQNTALDKQGASLQADLDNLKVKIADTQKRLDASEGDKKSLLAELKALQAKKDELEGKLKDLAFLKEQVKELKDQLAIDRRLDWIRRGLYDAIGMKGGERLTHPLPSVPPPTNNALNVEIRQNGGASIVAPSTNAPAAK